MAVSAGHWGDDVFWSYIQAGLMFAGFICLLGFLEISLGMLFIKKPLRDRFLMIAGFLTSIGTAWFAIIQFAG